MLAESLGPAEGAAAERKAKQGADEAEALRARQVEFETRARLAAEVARQAAAAEAARREGDAERAVTLPIHDWFAARDQSLARAERHLEDVPRPRETST